MSIELRLATQNDIIRLQELFLAAVNVTAKADYTEVQLATWSESTKNEKRWIDLVKDQFVVLAENSESLTGFGSLRDGDYVDFLYVHPDHLRMGIASLIYNTLKKEAQGRGTKSVSSDVSKTARPFFESKGFKVEKENRNVIRGVELINYRMTASL